MNFIDYRKKLGIGFENDKVKEMFFNRIIGFLENNPGIKTQMTEHEYLDFCFQIGYKPYDNVYDKSVWNSIITIFRYNRQSIKEFLSYYIFYVNCQVDNESKEYTKEQLIEVICSCLELSKIPYDLIKEKQNYFIFPKGAEELDQALVSEVLIWLENYPLSHKAFIKAIKEYSKMRDNNASDVADLFRKSLETFFQEFFNSSKTLENIKSEYGNYMKSKGVPKDLSNNFENLLQSYANFMNGYAKHHDKANKNVLEYIMYQTGNIIRLVITLKDKT